MIGEFGSLSRDGGRPEFWPLQVPCEANLGNEERPIVELASVDRVSIIGDDMRHQGPALPRRASRRAADFDVKTVGVKLLVGSMGGKMYDLRSVPGRNRYSSP